jgi:type IV fimbrial biogenesis protein FimT
MDPVHRNGFTLIELIITVSVLALLGSLALPGFSAILKNNAMTASANEIVMGFTLARSEALKRQAPVTICWTNDANAEAPDCGNGAGWHEGWIIFVDADGNAARDSGEAVVRRQSGLPGRDVVVHVGNLAAPLNTSLTYLPTGFPNFASPLPTNRNLLLCDKRADDAVARVVSLSPTGRPQVRRRDDFGNIGVSCES